MPLNKQSQTNSILSHRDYLVNTSQAILKGIPYIGGSLEQFIFGPLNELRMRRIESTLQEIAEILQQKELTAYVENEYFVNLLEVVVPSLSRSINEDRRQRFRDLLLNAAHTPPNDSDWEEAKLTFQLLDSIDGPGLAILAGISKSSSNSVSLVSKPTCQVFDGDFDFDNPLGPHHILPYKWPMIEEWARRLNEMRLIGYGSHDARGGFGHVYIRDLGKILVKWTVSEYDAPTERTQ